MNRGISTWISQALGYQLDIPGGGSIFSKPSSAARNMIPQLALEGQIFPYSVTSGNYLGLPYPHRHCTKYINIYKPAYTLKPVHIYTCAHTHEHGNTMHEQVHTSTHKQVCTCGQACIPMYTNMSVHTGFYNGILNISHSIMKISQLLHICQPHIPDIVLFLVLECSFWVH